MESRVERYTIGRARRCDVAALPSIELSAARLLSGHAPDDVLNETTPLRELEHARREGLLWVARLGASPVGFAHVVIHPDNVVHLQELDVLPEHGRRGIGRRLVRVVCRWARSRGMRAVTLTTFRHLRWNMPFYLTLGFEEIPARALRSALRRIQRDETRRGLEPSKRVAMQRILTPSRSRLRRCD